MVPYGLFKHPCIICLSFPYFSLNYSPTQVEYIPFSPLPLQLHPIIPSLQFVFSVPLVVVLYSPFFCGYSRLYKES